MKIEISTKELKELISIIKEQNTIEVIERTIPQEKKEKTDPNKDIMLFSNGYILERTKDFIKDSNLNEIIDHLKKECDIND